MSELLSISKMRALVYQTMIDFSYLDFNYVFMFIQNLLINLFSALYVSGKVESTEFLSFIHIECSHKVPSYFHKMFE